MVDKLVSPGPRNWTEEGGGLTKAGSTTLDRLIKFVQAVQSLKRVKAAKATNLSTAIALSNALKEAFNSFLAIFGVSGGVDDPPTEDEDIEGASSNTQILRQTALDTARRLRPQLASACPGLGGRWRRWLEWRRWWRRRRRLQPGLVAAVTARNHGGRHRRGWRRSGQCWRHIVLRGVVCRLRRWRWHLGQQWCWRWRRHLRRGRKWFRNDERYGRCAPWRRSGVDSTFGGGGGGNTTPASLATQSTAAAAAAGSTCWAAIPSTAAAVVAQTPRAAPELASMAAMVVRTVLPDRLRAAVAAGTHPGRMAAWL